MSTSAFRSSRMLTLQGAALGALLVANIAGTGWLYGPDPQILANGGYRELWLDHVDGPQGALGLFKRAVVMDSGFSYRWSDLGEALAGSGQPVAAEYCFRRSRELAPRSPQIAVRAMNFYFGQTETSSALRTAASVLDLTDNYDEIVFSSLTRFRTDLKSMLDVAIGSNRRAADSWFRYLIARGGGSGGVLQASETWAWIEDKGYVSRTAAIAWSDWLIRQHRGKEAFEVWKKHVATETGYGVANLVDNSGFEQAIEGRGFDWRIADCAGARARIDPTVVHSGKSSLRIDFDGRENVDFHHVTQDVWLEPGRYRLSAWVRAEGLSTDRGVTVELSGATTTELSGTQGWTRLNADITTAGKAAMGEVAVVRRRSWRFDSKVRGTVWIDDVELRRRD